MDVRFIYDNATELRTFRRISSVGWQEDGRWRRIPFETGCGHSQVRCFSTAPGFDVTVGIIRGSHTHGVRTPTPGIDKCQA